MTGGSRRRARPAGSALAIALAVALGGACTGGDSSGGPPPTGPDPGRTPSEAPAPEGRDLVLSVVASLTGPTSAVDRTYVDGMRLAERELNGDRIAGTRLRLDVADDGGDPAATGRLVEAAIDAPGPAVLLVGPASPVAEVRSRIETARRPVFLLGGDLYSTRELFRWVFQTSVPIRWQARVVARYLARDRGHERVVLVSPSAERAAVAREELASSGLEPAAEVAGAGPGFAGAADGADAVVALEPAAAAERIVRAAAGRRGSPTLRSSRSGPRP